MNAATELYKQHQELIKFLKEKIKLQEDYITLLSKGLSESAAFLHAHRWKYNKTDIEKGKEIRQQLTEINDKISQSERDH